MTEFPTTAGSGNQSGDCLDEATTAALIAGTLSPRLRASVFAHVDSCAKCRAVIADTVLLLREPGVVAEAGRINARARTRFLDSPGWRNTGAAVAAAAAILLAVAVPRFMSQRESGYRLRDGASIPLATPTAVAPAGTVLSPRNFVWTRPKGASEFRVTLFDFEGTIIWEGQLRDTVVALPADVKLATGKRYFWKVDAQLDLGRLASSHLQEFRVAAPPGRAGSSP